MRTFLAMIFTVLITAGVMVCTFTDDGRLACVYPTGGMEYTMDSDKPLIGFTTPFKPDNCAINQGKMGDHKWHEQPCSIKVTEE